MIRPVKQIGILLLALAMTAAPALACCAGPLIQGHAESGHGQKASAANAGIHADHDLTAAAHHRDNHPADHENGRDCGDCPACSGADMTTQDLALWSKAAAAQSGDGAAIMSSLGPRIFKSPVRHRLSRPQGPPLAPRTPVHLKTTLRL